MDRSRQRHRGSGVREWRIAMPAIATRSRRFRWPPAGVEILREATQRGHSIGKIAGPADAELSRQLADSGADSSGETAARALAAVVSDVPPEEIGSIAQRVGAAPIG